MSEWTDLAAVGVATGAVPAVSVLLLGESARVALLVGLAGVVGAALGVAIIHTYRDRWWMGDPWGERDG